MKELEKLIDGLTVGAGEMREVILRHKQSEGMRQSFRKAASDIAIEAGVLSAPVKHDEVAGTVLQDIYFLQLIAESELRLRSLSVRYEKLRAAAIGVLEAQGSITAASKAIEVLRDEVR
jgi:hypothetical protein